MSTEKDTVTVTSSSGGGDTVDDALQFVQYSDAQNVHTTEVDETALVRKIDKRIVPIMFLCYLMQFVDKVLLNYANVMGLSKDLKLKNNEFSWLATGFYLAYLIAEFPTNYLLHKLPVGRYLGANVVLWGIATACTAACHDFRSILAARIFLGIFEACIAPSLMLVTPMWYTKSEQAPRFGLWYCGLGVGQILGGAISFGFQHFTPANASIEGWRIMFIVLGIATVLVGGATYLYLPDSPMTSDWLTLDERIFAIRRVVERNQTGIRSRRFIPKHVVEALLDPQFYLLFVITVLVSLSSGVISTYSATLIRNFGFSSTMSALLNMPSGVVSIVAIVVSAIAIGRTNKRWLWSIALVIPGIIGGGLMSFLPVENKGGLLAAIYLINTIVAVLNIIYSWAACNIAGHTKKVVVNTSIMIGFSLGSIVSPMSFQAKDAPQYIPAKMLVLASQASVALVAVLLRLWYGYQNAKRERKALAVGALQEKKDQAWLNLTDKENTNFRYRY